MLNKVVLNVKDPSRKKNLIKKTFLFMADVPYPAEVNYMSRLMVITLSKERGKESNTHNSTEC